MAGRPHLLALVLFSLGLMCLAQPQPIPRAGYFHSIGSPTAPIRLDAFMDFQCPDSKASWPVMNQLMKHYGPTKLFFVFNVFPLPYHHNAFFASQATIVALNLTANPSTFWLMGDTLFNYQDDWSDTATHNMTAYQVIDLMASYASQCCQIQRNAFVDQMGYVTDQNIEARAMWKLGAALGIYGTPQFLVNNAYVPADSTWTADQWMQLLDPLL